MKGLGWKMGLSWWLYFRQLGSPVETGVEFLLFSDPYTVFSGLVQFDQFFKGFKGFH